MGGQSPPIKQSLDRYHYPSSQATAISLFLNRLTLKTYRQDGLILTPEVLRLTPLVR